ncbi:hypothetical protein SEA_KARDASHIAN_83 [Streptomyces phage Kardashian]|nr:hypothetical protein SEA_KARDASHIAN_83 [Streptomyces phage Kardashian]
MRRDYMVTVKENPYNYYTEFEDWYRWDTINGYHTLSYLAKVTRTSDALSPQLDEDAISDAVDEILSENVGGIYTKVEQPKDYVPSAE